jgi:hypothetical protein
MRRLSTIALGLTLGLLLAQTAGAQYGRRNYPRGYGGYGWGGWGADPQSGYMAGLGAYARGAGVYALDKAQADSINADTMIKWNKALRARQKALREEQQKDDARKQAEQARRDAERRVDDGTTLNRLLLEILDYDPGSVRSAAAKVRLSPAAIREVPFEWDSEALTVCLDQMTGRDGLPEVLKDPMYTPERDALRAAIDEALNEDRAGDVSEGTRKRITDAIARFRDKYRKGAGDAVDEVVSPSLDYFNTIAAIVPMLNDPGMRAILAKLEDAKETTVGDLVAFMNAYNLRFGPTTTGRQAQIYRDLVPLLTALRDSIGAGEAPASATPPDRTGEGLRRAAQGAFKGLGWDQIQAHSKSQ